MFEGDSQNVGFRFGFPFGFPLKPAKGQGGSLTETQTHTIWTDFSALSLPMAERGRKRARQPPGKRLKFPDGGMALVSGNRNGDISHGGNPELTLRVGQDC